MFTSAISSARTNLKVLVVDDDADVLSSLQRGLLKPSKF